MIDGEVTALSIQEQTKEELQKEIEVVTWQIELETQIQKDETFQVLTILVVSYKILKDNKPDIVIEKRGEENFQATHISSNNRASGRNSYEAVGDLIFNNQERFNVSIERP